MTNYIFGSEIHIRVGERHPLSYDNKVGRVKLDSFDIICLMYFIFYDFGKYVSINEPLSNGISHARM